jgi:hypothetical protein
VAAAQQGPPGQSEHRPWQLKGAAGSTSKTSAISNMASATSKGHEVRNCSTRRPSARHGFCRLRSGVVTGSSARPRRSKRPQQHLQEMLIVYRGRVTDVSGSRQARISITSRSGLSNHECLAHLPPVGVQAEWGSLASARLGPCGRCGRCGVLGPGVTWIAPLHLASNRGP